MKSYELFLFYATINNSTHTWGFHSKGQSGQSLTQGLPKPALHKCLTSRKKNKEEEALMV